MDVTVAPSGDGEWSLTDLLGRSMGCVIRNSDQEFVIRPDGHAIETMRGMKHGPHASLDDALAEIERHTRGVCRRPPGGDQT